MNTLIQYNSKSHLVHSEVSPHGAAKLIDSKMINWLDLELKDEKHLEEIGKQFDIHPLILEDIATDHLPKFEIFDEHIFFSVKMLWHDAETDKIVQEHLSIILGKGLIITFQEGLPGDVFDQIRRKIAQGKGLIRKHRADYLFYQIINAVMDNYLYIAELLRERIESLEEKLLEDATFQVSKEVLEIKRKVIQLRRYTLPMWDSLNRLKLEAGDYIAKGNQAYFYDIRDNLKFLLGFYDTSREMLRDLIDLHQTNLNNETNNVMRTLTIVSAIFIPMTFIAGVYGMNFHFMPELDYRYSYPIVGSIMVMTALTMVFILKKKKWL